MRIHGLSDASSGSAAALDITMPKYTGAGDLALVFAARNTAGTIGDGWGDNNGSTPFTADRVGDIEFGNGSLLSMFSRRILAGDPSTFNFVFVGDLGATTCSIVAMVLKDPDARLIYDVAPDGSTTIANTGNDFGALSMPSVTPTRMYGLHVLVSQREGGPHTGMGNHSGYITVGIPSNIAVFAKFLTDLSATGSQTLTASAAAPAVAQSFIVAGTPNNVRATHLLPILVAA